MFRRKQDVDKHVSSILLRKRDEKERNAQGYQIARLYADIREYSTARKYLSGFLSVRENVPSAYQLMGEINEGLGEKDVAIDNYKRALDLFGYVSSSKHLVKKICELYTQIGTDVPRMKYWLEQVEKLDPKSDMIFKVKAQIAEVDNDNGNNKSVEMENIISSELVKHPTDLKLRIKLLQLYLDTDRSDEAYDVAVTCDLTTAFVGALSWYECLSSIFKQHGEKNPDLKTDSSYNQHYLHVLRNLAYLRLWTKDVTDCVQALNMFDQHLKLAVTMGSSGEGWVAMLKEMKGQMFFLAALVLLKRAQTGALTWQEVNQLSGACLLASKSMEPLDAQAPWFVSAPATHAKFYTWWHQQSYDRLSQAGHMLQQLSQKKSWDDVSAWCQRVQRETMTSAGHQRLFELLFSPDNLRTQGMASFLFQAQEMVAAGSARDREPFTDQSLLDVDRVAYQVHLGDLNHLVWLCLQRYSPDMKAQPNYHFALMENIQYSVKDASNAAAESLCQLDILVFLLASVRCAATAISENILRYADSSGRPSLLPVCLAKPLCTPDQEEWWAAAFKFCTNSVKEDFSRLRRVLIRGLETVRLMDAHGVSVQMMAHIARSLDAKAKSYRSGQYGCRCSAYELSQLENRAAFYWERTKQALQKAQRNQQTMMPKKRLFKEVGDPDLSPVMLRPCLEEAEFSLALHAMKAERMEDALKGFERVRTPWAKFYSAKIYKLFADQESDRDVETEDSLLKRKALTEKARDCLYDTIDRLEGDKAHELNFLIYKELDELEEVLRGLELDERHSSPGHSFHTPIKSPSEIRSVTPGVAHSTPKPSVSGLSHVTNGTSALETPSRANQSVSRAANLVEDHEVSSSTDNGELTHIRPRPSPERLDAQLKSVSYSQSSMFKMVLDRNDELITVNSKLMEQLRDNNNQLKPVLTENHGLMSDLKTFLGENREMMRQIKNELSSLKTVLAQQQAAPHPPIAPTPPMYLPPHMAGVPPRGPPYPGFPPPAYPHGPGYMINSPMAGPPRPPMAMGPSYRPSGLPGSQSSNVGKYRSPSDEDDDEVDPDDLTSAEEAAALYAEYCEDTAYSQYFTPDSQMVPDWAGGRAGMESGPSMNLPPQGGQAAMPPRMNMPSPGYFASALRGQSLQYAQNTPPPAQVRPPPLGPGFFSSPMSSGAAPGTPSLLAALTGQATVSPGFVMPPAAESAEPTPSATTAAAPVNLSGLKSLFQSKGTLEPNKARGDITILVDTNSRRATILMMGDTKDIIFHHDIQGLALEQAAAGLSPSSVAWTATKIGTAAERERVCLSLESPQVAVQLREAILKATVLIQPKSIVQGVAATPSLFGSPGATSTPMAASTAAAAATTTTTAAAAPTAAPLFSTNTPAVASTTKPMFGGFTFSQAPVITPATPAEKPKAEAALPATTKAEAAKPFAGFSLTVSAPADSSTAPAATTTQKSPTKSPGGPADDDHVEEYEPNVDFKPVIALPDLVEKTTGEENETALFVERCRLYRFDSEAKQWKERGIGELKILKSNEQLKFRVIMRREQILKLCANHCLSADMKLTQMPSSDRAWCYTAMDYSEEEMKLEKLAAKFKTAEKAGVFKDVFTKCCQELKEAEAKSPPKKIEEKTPTKAAPASTKAPAKQETAPAKPQSLSELFKPKAGSWECDGCLVRNNADVIKCPACGNMKPGAKASDAPPAGQGMFGSTAGQGSGFTFASPAASSASSTGGFKFNLPASTTTAAAQPSGGFKFGGPAPTSAATTSQPSGGFKFGAPAATTTTTAPAAGGFLFGSLASSSGAPATTTTAAPATGGFMFGTPASSSGATAVTTTTATPATGGFIFGAPASSSGAPATGSGGFTFKTTAAATTITSAAPTTGFSFKLATTSSATTTSTTSGSGAAAKPVLFSFTPTTTATSTSQAKTAGLPASSSGLLAKLLTSDETKQAAPPAPKPAGGFSFTMPPKASNSSTNLAAAAPASQGFQFSFNKSPQKPAARSPAKPTVPGSPEVDEHGLYITKDGDDSHIHFEPVVALPDKIEVKTGEEDESVLFESRGKLYRFVSSEWKEKGLGVVKILEHRDTKKCRVLMRRDQILKICCNHVIDASLNLQPMARSEGKAWVWYALDFSEEAGKMEQLALRFKTADIASEFKAVFDKCRGSAQPTPPKDDGRDKGNVAAVKKELFKADSTSGQDDDVIFVKEEKPAGQSTEDEVIFVKEEKPTAEQVAMARKYLLPDTFYLYESRPPCPGCLGCTDGEFIPGKTFNSPQAAKDASKSVQSPVVSSGTAKFGSPSSSQTVFCAAAVTPPLFGSPATLGQTSFGSAAKSGQPVFGSAAKSGQPVFGSAAKPAQSLFGSTPTSQPLFGSSTSSSQPLFGSSAQSSQPTFGSVSSNLPDFSKLTSDAKSEESSSEAVSSGFVFGSKSTVDFSSLAAGGGGSDFTWKKTDSGPFSFAGAGQKLFGAAANTSGDADATGDDGVVAPSEDIHFEPVIPLPDLVEVKTGEEDWKQLFCQRSKLYKFDKSLSQWKERGIGEIKLMQHKTQVMFRVLQRREQVLKVSCNHLISPDMELKPMSTSETALCWTANDFTDNDPSVDQFAVKFKTKEIAAEFKTIFEDCQEQLRQNGGREEGAPNAQPSTSHNDDEEEEEYEEDEDYDEDEEDDDEEEEDEILYEKRATLNLFEGGAWKNLGTGSLVVTFNEDINGNAIRFSSDAGEKLCSHVITRELYVSCNAKGRCCEWKPIDYSTDEPVRRHFAASFSSTPAAEEFRATFEKGRQLALESDISENLPNEIDVPEVFSSGEPAH